jgi:hypothetical protein
MKINQNLIKKLPQSQGSELGGLMKFLEGNPETVIEELKKMDDDVRAINLSKATMSLKNGADFLFGGSITDTYNAIDSKAGGLVSTITTGNQMPSDRKIMRHINSNENVIGQSNAHHSAIVTKTAYEGTVIARAMERAGHNPHLKGHIHELLVQDARNARNLLTLNGASTNLTRSTTAGTVDLVTTKGGKVIERIQVKDVTSRAGIDKLVKQCAGGKYRSAQLVGSEESTQVFNKAAERAGISKRMTSTGVSSKSTESLAQRAGATGSGTLGSAITQAAKAGGAAGAVIGGGIAAMKGCADLFNGRADVTDVASTVVKASAKGGLGGAAAGAAATATGAGAVAVVSALGLGGMAATAVTVGAPITAAIVVGYIASEVFDGVCNFFNDLV